MEIDIISYTSEQYAKLNDAQLLEVQSAQMKKNRLFRKLSQAKQDEKNRLIENNTFLSELWDLYCARLEEEYEQEVDAIRDGLLFYLQYSVRVEEENSSPYTVNYALTMEERLAIVRAYYETNYKDATECFEAFKADKIAVGYLGEYYAPLYDHFLALTRK